MNEYKIIYDKLAIVDLRNILFYLFGHYLNYEKAQQFTQEIREKIKILSFSPEMYEQVNDFKNNSIRRMPVKKYLIFYSINKQENIVSIHRILHGGVDISQIAMSD